MNAWDLLGLSVPATPDVSFNYGGYEAKCPSDTLNGEKWVMVEAGLSVSDTVKGPETVRDSTEGDVFGAKAWRIMTRQDIGYKVVEADIGQIGASSCGEGRSFSTYVEKTNAHTLSIGGGGNGDNWSVSGHYEYSWGGTTGTQISTGEFKEDGYEFVGIAVELQASLYNVHASFYADYYGAPWQRFKASAFRVDTIKVRPGIMVCKRKCKCDDAPAKVKP